MREGDDDPPAAPNGCIINTKGGGGYNTGDEVPCFFVWIQLLRQWVYPNVSPSIEVQCNSEHDLGKAECQHVNSFSHHCNPQIVGRFLW